MVARAAARKQILACATWLVLQAIDEASRLEGLELTHADYAEEIAPGHASPTDGGLPPSDGDLDHGHTGSYCDNGYKYCIGL